MKLNSLQKGPSDPTLRPEDYHLLRTCVSIRKQEGCQRKGCAHGHDHLAERDLMQDKGYRNAHVTHNGPTKN